MYFCIKRRISVNLSVIDIGSVQTDPLHMMMLRNSCDIIAKKKNNNNHSKKLLSLVDGGECYENVWKRKHSDEDDRCLLSILAEQLSARLLRENTQKHFSVSSVYSLCNTQKVTHACQLCIKTGSKPVRGWQMTTCPQTNTEKNPNGFVQTSISTVWETQSQ